MACTSSSIQVSILTRMRRNSHLFYQGFLNEELQKRTNSIRHRVDSIPEDQFLNSTPEEVANYIEQELTLDPLVLYEDRREMEQRESAVEVVSSLARDGFRRQGPQTTPGVSLKVYIPFSGNPLLWTLRPSQYRNVFPSGSVASTTADVIGLLCIEIEVPAYQEPARIKAKLEADLESLRFYLTSQNSEVEHWNQRLRDAILPSVKARRERLEKHKGLSGMLGIPLKEKAGVPSTPLNLPRKLVRPLPVVPAAGFAPEPGISEEDYKHILAVIRHESRTYETTPGTFSVLGEEDIRNILLAHLNSHYEGAATGETFRGSGKTDIRIEDSSRSAFVAECKVWKGSGELTKAINQLLGYLTWRDCKTALVIFNKHNARFSDIQSQIEGIFQGHQCFKRSLMEGSQGEWEFSMASLQDAGRIARVHVFVFNLYHPRATQHQDPADC